MDARPAQELAGARLLTSEASASDVFPILWIWLGLHLGMSSKMQTARRFSARRSMIILFYINGNARSSLPMRANLAGLNFIIAKPRR